MSTWLGNIPDPRVRYTRSVRASELEQLESLLAFIQTSQPEATMDHLVEEVLETFFRKRNRDFPVPEESVKLVAQIPSTLRERVEREVEQARAHEPRASEDDLVSYAIETYFKRSTQLISAWREHDEQTARREDAGLQSESSLDDTPAEDSALSVKPTERTAQVIDEVRGKYLAGGSEPDVGDQ